LRVAASLRSDEEAAAEPGFGADEEPPEKDTADVVSGSNAA
jgi:hypothetical protein